MKERTIFISYEEKTKPDIQTVITELKSKGVVEDGDKIINTSDVLIPGSSVRGALREAVKASSKVVVVWNRKGAESEFVNYEMAMADALDKSIIIVVPKGQRSKIPDEITNKVILEMEESAIEKRAIADEELVVRKEVVERPETVHMKEGAIEKRAIADGELVVRKEVVERPETVHMKERAIEKRAIADGELVVRKEAVERPETVPDTVRRTRRKSER